MRQRLGQQGGKAWLGEIHGVCCIDLDPETCGHEQGRCGEECHRWECQEKFARQAKGQSTKF